MLTFVVNFPRKICRNSLDRFVFLFDIAGADQCKCYQNLTECPAFKFFFFLRVICDMFVNYNLSLISVFLMFDN